MLKVQTWVGDYKFTTIPCFLAPSTCTPPHCFLPDCGSSLLRSLLGEILHLCWFPFYPRSWTLSMFELDKNICETAIKCVNWKYFPNISLTFLFYCKASQNSFLMTSSSPGRRSLVSVVTSKWIIWSCWGLRGAPLSAFLLWEVTNSGCSQAMLQLSKLMVNANQKLYETNCSNVNISGN